MKIERPDWDNIVDYSNYMTTNDKLDNWFQEQIEPINKMLSEGVEVKGCYRKKSDGWARNGWAFDANYIDEKTTHKALFINIEPIKQKSREERLEEFVKDTFNLLGNIPELYGNVEQIDLIKKAKALLEEAK